MQLLPRQVIMAIAIVDLPIDLDRKDSPQLRDGHGGSLWYLACDTDDHYADVVEEIVSICSFAQVREMCFMSGPGGEPLITRATKRCMAIMQKSLRFLSRFEFISTSPIYSDQSLGIKMFDALDFGTDLQPFDEGRPIILKCYSDEEVFAQEIQLVGNLELDFSLLEEISIHSVDRESSNGKQYCVAIEQAELTLQDVVSGMLDNEECQTDVGVRKRYAGKVFSVLRLVGKALAHLHSLGVIHGCVSLEHVGKFQSKWKLSEVMIIQRIGEVFNSGMFSKASPPEAIKVDNVSTSEVRAMFRSNFIVDESIDVWAFGNMAFEVLVGEPLVDSDPTKEFDQDHSRLLDIVQWGDFNLQQISQKLRLKGVGESGIDLITMCLSPDARNRPSAMQILSHPVWKELRREKG
jgi:Protein kinase domain